MDSVIESIPVYLAGFRMTLYLTVVSGLLSLVLGTVLAACRVSPLRSLRGVSTVIVEVARNTPLTLVFIFFVFILVWAEAKFKEEDPRQKRREEEEKRKEEETARRRQFRWR